MIRCSLLIAFALVAGEDISTPSPSRTPAAVPVDAGLAGWPATLEDRAFDIAWHDMHATLKGRVPVGWISRTPGHFKVPDGGLPGILDPSISYAFGGISCDGECDDGDLQRSMVDAWKSYNNTYGLVSSGLGETDKLRLDVKTLEEGDFLDGTYKAGKYKAVRVTRGANSPGAPEYLERFEATCVRHRKGDPFYIVVTAMVKPVYEHTLWPLLLEACKTPWFRS